jgi:hypothetical protein
MLALTPLSRDVPDYTHRRKSNLAMPESGAALSTSDTAHSGGVDREGTGVQHVVRVHALLHEDGPGAVKDRDGRHRSPVDPAGLVVGFERIEADAGHGAIPAP